MNNDDAMTSMLADIATVHDGIDAYTDRLVDDEVALIHTLRHVREARQRLTTIERALEDAAVRAWPRDAGKRLALDGEWIAERNFGKDRKAWQHEDVQRAVVAQALAEVVDETTGEIIEPNATTWAVRDALIAAANPTWRVSALKKMGIDPDEFCHAEKGRATIQITPTEGTSIDE